MKKSVKIIICSVIIVISITLILLVFLNLNNTHIGKTPLKTTQGVYIVPTMQDVIANDSAWCATFQLVWNDMKNEVAKQDVVFSPQEEMASNLNKEEFSEKLISDDYYFKIYGLKTLELKEKIEKGIEEKFNQKSDILDDFDWDTENLDNPDNLDVRRYFFYTMLYRKFEYKNKFEKLDNGDFASKYNDVKYFGINKNRSKNVREQINVLYYNSKDDFAIVLNTKSNDEVILCKNPKGNTFKEIYENMLKKEKDYTGKKTFEEIDEFKAPIIEFNIKREYEELENKPFITKDNHTAEIEKAIQTVKLSLDEEGGYIKSEAAIDVKDVSAALPDVKDTPRLFYLNNTFALFLREKGRDLPYFATRIEDIKKYH